MGRTSRHSTQRPRARPTEPSNGWKGADAIRHGLCGAVSKWSSQLSIHGIEELIECGFQRQDLTISYNHINIIKSSAVMVKKDHFLSWQVEDLLDAFRCEVSDTDSGSEGPSELEEGAADSRSQGPHRLPSSR